MTPLMVAELDDVSSCGATTADLLRAELAEVYAERDLLRAMVLDMSDAADVARQLDHDDARRIGAAEYERGERDGYERGARTLADGWARYWPDRAAAPSADEQECRRWGGGGRERYAEAAEGDRTGAQIVADARASWETAGFTLPPVGWLYLGGPPTHHHNCGAACRAIVPGWYSPDDAAAIIATLPTGSDRA